MELTILRKSSIADKGLVLKIYKNINYDLLKSLDENDKRKIYDVKIQ